MIIQHLPGSSLGPALAMLLCIAWQLHMITHAQAQYRRAVECYQASLREIQKRGHHLPLLCGTSADENLIRARRTHRAHITLQVLGLLLSLAAIFAISYFGA